MSKPQGSSLRVPTVLSTERQWFSDPVFGALADEYLGDFDPETHTTCPVCNCEYVVIEGQQQNGCTRCGESK